MHCKQLPKLKNWQKQLTFWMVTQSSSVSLQAPIFSLQAHSVQKTFPQSKKFQREFSLYWQIVSHFLLCSAMSGRLFHEEETLKYHFIFKQVQQSYLCGSCMSSSYSIVLNSSGKNSFLPKRLINSIRSLFDVYHPLEIIGAARSRCVSLSWKS